MAKRRGGFGGWLSHLKGWQLVIGFLVVATTAGSAVLATVSQFERTYGIAASWLGFATVRGVDAQLTPIGTRLDRAFQWQLYETSRRLTRQIDDLKARPKPTRADQERLAELTEQLAEVRQEYDSLRKKVRP